MNQNALYVKHHPSQFTAIRVWAFIEGETAKIVDVQGRLVATRPITSLCFDGTTLESSLGWKRWAWVACLKINERSRRNQLSEWDKRIRNIVKSAYLRTMQETANERDRQRRGVTRGTKSKRQATDTWAASIKHMQVTGSRQRKSYVDPWSKWAASVVKNSERRSRRVNGGANNREADTGSA